MKNGNVLRLCDKVKRQARYSQMKKVLLLSNVPSPYLTPLFNKLARETGWELLVCYVSRWNQNVGWSLAQVQNYLANGETVLDEHARWLSKLSSQWAAALCLLAKLRKQQPDYLVIYGYTRAPQLTALLWCSLTRRPFAIAGDATYYADSATGIRKLVKTYWLRLIIRWAAAILVVGKASRMFWEAYGARPEQIYEAPFAVDNDWFAAESQRQRPAAEVFRRGHGWEGKTIFLYVGRLIKRKNVDLLVTALQQMPQEQAVLLVTGNGEEHEALVALAAGHPRIRFVGNASQQELAFYYALADVLVLPARSEPWGLVINEAMACGLAVIAHWQCGAAVDLVAADNGIVLHSFAVDELAVAINTLAVEREKLTLLQQQSSLKIARWSFEHAAAAIRRAVESAGRAEKLRAKVVATPHDWENTQ